MRKANREAVESIEGRRGQSSYPPLLTGGLERQDAMLGELWSVGVDWLTFTICGEGKPDAARDYLMSQTFFEEAGKARPGFAESEIRTCLGGRIWRRMAPHVPSKEFGVDYESWECSSGTAHAMAGVLRGRGKIRPSRIDVAFDYSVRGEVTADAFVWALQRASGDTGEKLRGRKLGINGEGGTNTRYVGSRQSEKRIRIYRKDLESRGFAELVGPTLRVELTLKGEQANRWWQLWDEDRERAKLAASTLVGEMTGFYPLEGREVLPEAELPEAVGSSEQLALFIEQHGPTLRAFTEAGIDVVGLASEHGAMVGTKSRKVRWRYGRRLSELQRVGVEQVVSLARVLLGLKPVGAAGSR